MEGLISLLVGFFCLLQVADAVTTYTVLDQGGRELNPVMRYVMDKMGMVPGLIVAKLALIIVVLVAFNLNVFSTVFGFICLCVVCSLFVAVVLHNWKQIAH